MTRKQLLPAMAFLVFQTSMSVNLLPAFSADDASNTALVDLIRHSNIVNPSYKLTAAVAAGEALITTQCKPNSSEADRKIEAVLIAKTAFESVPDSVQRVKLVLLDYDANDCSSITVKRAEVKLFGSGGLSQKELLDSLEITKSANAVVATDASVADGPEQMVRMLTLGRIEKLKSQGANVSGYMSFFKQIEDAAKAGDVSSVKEKCAYLGEKLTDQESCIKQIRTRPVAVGKKDVIASATTPATAPATSNVPRVAPSPASVKQALRNTLSANDLASIDPVTIGLGMRQMTMSEKLQALSSRGVDTKQALSLCVYAQTLLYKGDVRGADSVLASLERQFGR